MRCISSCFELLCGEQASLYHSQSISEPQTQTAPAASVARPAGPPESVCVKGDHGGSLHPIPCRHPATDASWSLVSTLHFADPGIAAIHTPDPPFWGQKRLNSPVMLDTRKFVLWTLKCSFTDSISLLA